MSVQLALVTGAGRGIGREVVKALLEQGYRVIATGRDQTALDRMAAEFASGLIEIAIVDLDSPELENAAAAAIGGRPLDLLVLNAARFSPWDETVSVATMADARSTMETNLFGSWRLIQATLPAIREAHGAILTVGSGSGSHDDPQFGLSVNPGAASYAVSKAALHALMHKLATEVADEDVRVWVSDPGLTATSPGMEELGARPVAEGAASVLAPVLQSLPSGTFSRDGTPLPW